MTVESVTGVLLAFWSLTRIIYLCLRVLWVGSDNVINTFYMYLQDALDIYIVSLQPWSSTKVPNLSHSSLSILDITNILRVIKFSIKIRKNFVTTFLFPNIIFQHICISYTVKNYFYKIILRKIKLYFYWFKVYSKLVEKNKILWLSYPWDFISKDMRREIKKKGKNLHIYWSYPAGRTQRSIRVKTVDIYRGLNFLEKRGISPRNVVLMPRNIRYPSVICLWTM